MIMNSVRVMSCAMFFRAIAVLRGGVMIKRVKPIVVCGIIVLALNGFIALLPQGLGPHPSRRWEEGAVDLTAFAGSATNGPPFFMMNVVVEKTLEHLRKRKPSGDWSLLSVGMHRDENSGEWEYVVVFQKRGFFGGFEIICLKMNGDVGFYE